MTNDKGHDNSRRGHTKITAVIVIFAVTLVGVLWLFTFSRISSEHRAEVTAITRANANLAKAFEENVRRNLLAMDDVLLYVKEEFEEHGFVGPGVIERVKRNKAVPMVHVSVADSTGAIVASSLPGLLGVKVRDGEYFRHLAVIDDGRPYFSRPIVGQVTKEWLFHISRRLNKPDKGFAGTVTIGVDPVYFSRFYREMRLGDAYSVGLVGLDGFIRIRQSGDKLDVGTDIRQAPFFRNLQQAPAGSFVDVAVVDGQRRIFSYRTMPDFPLAIVVTVREDDAMAECYQRRLGYCLAAAVVTLLILAFSIFLGRLVTQKAAAEEALRHVNEQLEARVTERTEELAAANQELLRLSVLDGLTGIANRRSFDQYLEREWKGAMRRHKPLVLLLADIDFFKAYNDTYGHQLGDDCLKKVAAVLRDRVKRATDMVARYGGEEFAIVLPSNDETGGMIIAEDIRKHIEDLGLEHKSAPLGRLTISLGVAVAVPKARQSEQVLLALADTALYAAKRNGRNRVERVIDLDAQP
jgi:diguanylate cyclase (GGDEF)-like protein